MRTQEAWVKAPLDPPRWAAPTPARPRPAERQWLRVPVKAGSDGVTSDGSVDRANRVIRGVPMMEQGEVRGHGFRIDQTTLKMAQELGNASRLGPKMNFGHENGSDDSIGKFAGRATNWRLDGSRVIADATIDRSAFIASPELAEHLFIRAESDPRSMGASLVLKMKLEKELDENGDPATDGEGNVLLPFSRPTEIMGADFVGNPAATTSLLSGTNALASEELTRILDDVLSRPDAPERVISFLERYMENRPNEDTMEPEVDATEAQEPEKEAKGLVARLQELWGAKASTQSDDLPAGSPVPPISIKPPDLSHSPVGHPVAPILLKPLDQSETQPPTDVNAALAATVAQQSEQIARMLSMMEATQQSQKAISATRLHQRIDAMVPTTALSVKSAKSMRDVVTAILGSGANEAEAEAFVAQIEAMPRVEQAASLSHEITFQPIDGAPARARNVDLRSYGTLKTPGGAFTLSDPDKAAALAAVRDMPGATEAEKDAAEMAAIKADFDANGGWS